MISWHTVRGRDGRHEVVEVYDDMQAALDALAETSWEEPGNAWLSYLCDDRGEVVAVAIFGPAMGLLVACDDGRSLRFEMPGHYGG